MRSGEQGWKPAGLLHKQSMKQYAAGSCADADCCLKQSSREVWQGGVAATHGSSSMRPPWLSSAGAPQRVSCYACTQQWLSVPQPVICVLLYVFSDIGWVVGCLLCPCLLHKCSTLAVNCCAAPQGVLAACFDMDGIVLIQQIWSYTNVCFLKEVILSLFKSASEKTLELSMSSAFLLTCAQQALRADASWQQ